MPFGFLAQVQKDFAMYKSKVRLVTCVKRRLRPPFPRPHGSLQLHPIRLPPDAIGRSQAHTTHGLWWPCGACGTGIQAYDAIAYAFNREFSPVLRRNMATFSRNSGGDALSAARGEVEQVKGIMVQNIEKVLERGEHIDLLVDKTENLESEVRRGCRSCFWLVIASATPALPACPPACILHLTIPPLVDPR